MYLIVGLGNPENEYANTRHNVGFNVVNKLADKNNIKLNKEKFNGIYGVGTINNQKVILVKPQTYMNLSGECAIQFANFYKLHAEEIIIVLDDIEMNPGQIRIRKKGSAGTHNGLKSIINSFGTTNISRIRVGIGKPQNGIDLATFVLSKIKPQEKQIIEIGEDIAVEAIEYVLKNNVDKAMNIYNGGKE